jgi:transcription-repair coupling factor (superfamily II helicase)
LLVDEASRLTPNATKRLLALQDFSSMVVGSSLSMRDLEIRGAASLLGTQQSGHIAVVGYELYCRLLEQAVRGIKKMPPFDEARRMLDFTTLRCRSIDLGIDSITRHPGMIMIGHHDRDAIDRLRKAAAKKNRVVRIGFSGAH